MSTLTVGTIAEKVTDAGVAVDGVTLKDGGAVFTSAITATDNTVDLGASSTRFKDIYLSGGAFLGGTGSANKISDYEEGTFIPLCNFTGGAPSAGATAGKGQYTKIGRQVHLHFLLSNINVSGASGDIQIQNMPFTSLADSGDGAVANFLGTAKSNNCNFAGSTFLNSQMADNTTNCKITECIDNASADVITSGNCTDGTTDFIVSISYTTAS